MLLALHSCSDPQVFEFHQRQRCYEALGPALHIWKAEAVEAWNPDAGSKRSPHPTNRNVAASD